MIEKYKNKIIGRLIYENISFDIYPLDIVSGFILGDTWCLALPDLVTSSYRLYKNKKIISAWNKICLNDCDLDEIINAIKTL